MNEPLISVIIPTFNREHLLPCAIDSVIKQTYTNWELIIVDDRSTDNTNVLIGNYAKKYKNIRYISNTRQQGPAGARNSGILKAKGEYIAFLDSDDQWLEHHLMNSIKALKAEHVYASLSFWYEKKDDTLYEVNGDDGMSLKQIVKKLNLQPKVIDKAYYFNKDFYEISILKDAYFFHINTLVVHKKVIEKTGLFNEKLRASEDDDYIYRIFYNFDFCFIDDFHFIYNFDIGNNGIYSFFDRNNVIMKDLINNIKLIRGVTNFNKSSCFSKITKVKFVNKSKRIEDKKSCIKILKRKISGMYYTIGMVNIKLFKLTSLYYFSKSLYYNCSRDNLKAILGALFCKNCNFSNKILERMDFG